MTICSDPSEGSPPWPPSTEITAAGALASAARHRRERELADVTAVAEAAQRILLRPVSGEIGPIRLATRYVSASASARIGGDLYGVVAAPRAVRLIIADVQGKGLTAAQTAAVVLGVFREAAYDAPGLADIAARIETSLERQTTEEEFVTAVLAQIADGGSTVEVLNCGHPPPLLVSGGTVRLVDPPAAGLPLGLAPLAVSARETSTIELTPEGRLLFYTDGISEARDRAGAFYPLDRCAALLGPDDLDTALDHLSKDVVHHVGDRLRDDAAMLLISQRSGQQVADRGDETAQTEHRAPERRGLTTP
jgi:serine phosphatase RsbU (regulator of sigma subunit)